MTISDHGEGRVVRVAGPVVTATGLERARLYNVVRVGEHGLVGEIIRLEQHRAVVQVYEDTIGLRVGDPVVDTGSALSVELGPGLLGSIFDGVQSLLTHGPGGAPAPFLERGVTRRALDARRHRRVHHSVEVGDHVEPGDEVATTPETATLTHRILVPDGVSGEVTALGSTDATIDDPVVWIDGEALGMRTRWPVRTPRPVATRLDPTVPLVTGQRVVDSFFPVARGGTATIPGGFGTGKTVLEQAFARWADADVVVYVACGERGNEMAELLEEFPKLPDPRGGGTLMDRTIVVVNTSNMPVAAREAGIYTGITIAEYYRDQGYDVALLADSTSRWAEALREVSSRLEELPGEEGYPAYLPARLAEFYERAGAVRTLGRAERTGSVTVVAAVSPPGGDLSEPVTQQSLRLAGTFWALDVTLAQRRHFPAIHWSRSYSLYDLGPWFGSRTVDDWDAQRRWAIELLAEEERLGNLVQLLGLDVLAPAERVVFQTGRILREDFLQQSAFDEVDAFCTLDKQYWMLHVIRHLHERLIATVTDEIAVEHMARLEVLTDVARMRSWLPEEAEDRARELVARIDAEVGGAP